MPDTPNPENSLAIIGIGCLLPKADSLAEYWNNIREGVDAISDIPQSHWDPEKYFNPDQNVPDMTYARRGGFLNAIDFDPLQYGISPNNIEATDTTQLLGMVVAKQALLDAGYATTKTANDGKAFDRDRTSVIMGVTGALELVIPLGARLGHPIWRKALYEAGVDPETTEDVVQRIAENYVPWQENSFPGLLGNVAAGRIANRFDLGGTNCVVDAACASSLSAIHMAALELNAGRSDMAIAGGIDTFNDIFMYMCFSKTPALSHTGDGRPFSTNRDGTILGEGVGAVILKRISDAQRDQDKIYAVIKGIGSSSDGHGKSIYAPSATGQVKALKDAYIQANIAPRSIELIEAHGTGTTVGDEVEVNALNAVYSESNANHTWCAIGSVKSMIGHTKAAAGIAGMIKIIMALKHKVLPPSIKVEQPLKALEPGTAPIYINTIKRPWVDNAKHPRRAALSAFGFGGSNFHCVLEEAPSNRHNIEPDWDGNVLLIALAADSVELIAKQLATIKTQTWSQLRAFAARTCRDFDANQACRMIIVVEKNTDVQALLQKIKKQLSQGTGENAYQLPDGVYYAAGSDPDKIAMIYPGQGAQYVGMLRDLACQFPQFNAMLSSANSLQKNSKNGTRLSDIIYPIPVFSDAACSAQEKVLQKTQNAQPALGVVSLAGFRLLQQFGFQADFAAGHSYGELVALCAAGILDEVDFHRLSRLRGTLMAQTKAGQDNGAMLAVFATLETIKPLLSKNNIDVTIANHNAPKQIVLSGATENIRQASKIFKAEKIRSVKLPVSGAFHSSFVGHAAAPFANALEKIQLHASTIKVLSNTTADYYPDSTNPENHKLIKKLLSEQLTHPVKFVEQITKLYSKGVRTFVEIGPGRRLSGLIETILEGNKFQVLALDASAKKRHGLIDLAHLLGKLAVLGKVSLKTWDTAHLNSINTENVAKPSMKIPLSGANYVMPREKRVAKKVNSSKIQKTTTTDAHEKIRAVHENIISLQKMQQQIAHLHQEYLDGQATSQQAIAALLQQNAPELNIAEIAKQPIQTLKKLATHAEPATLEKLATHAEPAKLEKLITQAEPATLEKLATHAEPNRTDSFSHVLLTIVAEKTGYPLEMLNLDMSLDTDLGIDSIKRVEILAALQEQLPQAPVVNPEDMAELKTLQQIISYVSSKDAIKKTHPIDKIKKAKTFDKEKLASIMLTIIAEKTGYPAEMLNLDMSLDTDLGIDSIKRVEILAALQEQLPQAPVVNPEDMAELKTLQQIISYLSSKDAIKKTHPIDKTNKAKTFDKEKLASIMLTIIAEKTGYPAEMLNLDMSLDTDLGIDSIKRVEILAALQEQFPDLPVGKPEDIEANQTVQQIIDHIYGYKKTSDVDKASATHKKTDIAKIADFSENTDISKTVKLAKIADFSENTDISKTVELPKIADISEAVDTAKTTPLIIQRKIPTIVTLKNNAEKISLAENAVVWVTGETSQLAKKICTALEKNGVNAKNVALDATPETALAGLIILMPKNPSQEHMKDIFLLVQRAGKTLRAAGKSKAAILTSITRLGGKFALEGMNNACPISGGIAGLVKTAAKEWNEVTCKAIDIQEHGNLTIFAKNIANECLTTGPVEIGLSYTDNKNLQRSTIQLKDTPIDQQRKAIPLLAKDVIVVTGGARGVTVEISLALAKTYQTNLLLFGRTQEPKPEIEWLKGLTTEKAIKKAILANQQNKKGKLNEISPRVINSIYRKILADREIRENLERIKATGVEIIYRVVDVQDKNAVINAINEARKTFGNIRGIVHGAGVLADKLILDKTENQFSQVYSTKVAGIHSLLTATKDDPLKILVMFSSSTARFGRIGQCDYAVANEVLNKIAQQQATLRKDCRVVSMNWGPWDGGMVTPTLKKLFQSEGIGLIPLTEGANYFMQEIAYHGPVEIVALGLGTKNSDNPAKQKDKTEKATPLSNLSVSYTRTLNITDHSFMTSHVMQGKAVLPAAMMIEWMAHGAINSNPGFYYHGCKNFRIFKGVVLAADENLSVEIMTDHGVNDANPVAVELHSENGLHAQAEIILSDKEIVAQARQNKNIVGQYSQSNTDIYTSARLFHGEILQGILSIDGCTPEGIAGKIKTASIPTKWMKEPMRSSWLTDPLALDCSFQIMILWCFEQFGIASLPTSIGEYWQFHKKFPAKNCLININIRKHTKYQAIADIEFIDAKNQLIARIKDYECIMDPALKKAFSQNKL